MTLASLFLLTSMSLRIPSGLLSSVCYVESKHDVAAIHYNDGKSKSLGVCQVKVATAKALGFSGGEQDLLSAPVNIYYAGVILSYHIDRCRTIDDAIMAYNSGKCAKGSKKYLKAVKRYYGTK